MTTTAEDDFLFGAAPGAEPGPPTEETEASKALVPLARVMGDVTRHALVGVEAHRDPDLMREAVAALARAAREIVEARWSPLRDRRRQLVGDRRVMPADLAPELTELADLAEAMEGVARSILSGAESAKGIAGDLVDGELFKRSVKVGDGHGQDLSVKIEQRTELSCRADEIVKVVRGSLAVAWDSTQHGEAATPGTAARDSLAAYRDQYLAGVDDGIGKLRELLSASPTFRSTALDAFATDLTDCYGEAGAALAASLQRAYGREPVGDPKVKIERVERKAPKGGASS